MKTRRWVWPVLWPSCFAIIILCTVGQKLFFKYAFDDGTSDESKAAVRKRKRAEKAARKGGSLA